MQTSVIGRIALFGLPALVVLLAPTPSGPAEPTERIIRIEASSFAYKPALIAVAQGDHITIELVATDVVHGLHIDGYDLSVVADPGQTRRLTFVADRQGMFRIRCSVPCGPLHPFMIGKLKVGTNWLLWRAVGLAVLVALAAVVAFRR